MTIKRFDEMTTGDVVICGQKIFVVIGINPNGLWASDGPRYIVHPLANIKEGTPIVKGPFTSHSRFGDSTYFTFKNRLSPWNIPEYKGYTKKEVINHIDINFESSRKKMIKVSLRSYKDMERLE